MNTLHQLWVTAPHLRAVSHQAPAFPPPSLCPCPPFSPSPAASNSGTRPLSSRCGKERENLIAGTVGPTHSKQLAGRRGAEDQALGCQHLGELGGGRCWRHWAAAGGGWGSQSCSRRLRSGVPSGQRLSLPVSRLQTFEPGFWELRRLLRKTRHLCWPAAWASLRLDGAGGGGAGGSQGRRSHLE